MAVFPLSLPVFRPSMQVITAISTSQQQNKTLFLITTGQAHFYQVGLVIRCVIPQSFGMQSLNGQTVTIISVPAPTTFVVTQINDSGIFNDPFVIPIGAQQSATTIPVAETDFQLNQAVHNVLPLGI